MGGAPCPAPPCPEGPCGQHRRIARISFLFFPRGTRDRSFHGRRRAASPWGQEGQRRAAPGSRAFRARGTPMSQSPFQTRRKKRLQVEDAA